MVISYVCMIFVNIYLVCFMYILQGFCEEIINIFHCQLSLSLKASHIMHMQIQRSMQPKSNGVFLRLNLTACCLLILLSWNSPTTIGAWLRNNTS